MLPRKTGVNKKCGHIYVLYNKGALFLVKATSRTPVLRTVSILQPTSYFLPLLFLLSTNIVVKFFRAYFLDPFLYSFPL